MIPGLVDMISVSHHELVELIRPGTQLGVYPVDPFLAVGQALTSPVCARIS